MRNNRRRIIWLFVLYTLCLWLAGVSKGAEPEIQGPPELIIYEFADPDEMPYGEVKMKWERPCHQIEHGFWSDWYPTEYWVFIDCGDTDKDGNKVYLVKRLPYEVWLRVIEGNFYPYCG